MRCQRVIVRVGSQMAGVAVGDDEDGGRQFPHGAGDTALGGLVEGRGGFVENRTGASLRKARAIATR